MRRLALEPSTYEGPTGIVGVLQEALRQGGRARRSPCGPRCRTTWRRRRRPRRRLALLHRVEELLDVTVPLEELAEDARAWEHGVDELAAEDTRSRSTSASSRRPRTPRTCPRRAARRSPASSSATCAAAATTSRRCHVPAEPGRVTASEAATPSRASTCVAHQGAAALPSAASGPPLSASSGLTAPSGRRRPGRPARPGRRPVPRGPPEQAVGAGPAGSETAARQRASRSPPRPRAPRRSTPSRRGSGGRAWRAGSPAGPPRPRAAGRQDQVALGLAHLLAVQPHHPGVHVGARERGSPVSDLRVRRRPSRGAGRRGRSRRPGRRSPAPRCSRAMAVHSMCQPGRPRPSGPPSQLGSPSRAARQSSGSSGCFLPGRSGSPPRSANTASMAGSSRRETAPKSRVGVRRRSRRRRRARTPSPAPVGVALLEQVGDERDDPRDRLDRADVVVGRQHAQGRHVVAEELRSGRSASSRQSTPVAAARSSRGSSTSVTFWT